MNDERPPATEGKLLWLLLAGGSSLALGSGMSHLDPPALTILYLSPPAAATF
jgi:hypothetical protein